jgi:3-oxoacyl-[acyl-carrier protein] reductase
MNLGLAGKNALITAASRGIGRGVAEALRAEGANIVVCARDISAVEQTGGLTALECDLSDAESIARLVPGARRVLGSIDILVVNGGRHPPEEVGGLPGESWQTWFQSMWMSTVDLLGRVLPSMTEQRFGRILLVASLAARDPIENLALSNSLRASLLGLLRSVSGPVAGKGVTVNAILTGCTETSRPSGDVETDTGALSRSVPAGRLGTVEEVGALAAFLASTHAGYMTGQAIACDGGLSRSI